MRKLKLQVQMTIDGYIARPDGSMDWAVTNWDDELKDYIGKITDPVDCIVLGRKLAEGFIPYWSGVAADKDNPDTDAGKKFTNTHKVVFTNTLAESKWKHTVLAKGEIADEINALKRQDGGDIIAYGGAGFVSSLIKHNLIDEYHLLINPNALGKGMAIFSELNNQLNLVPKDAHDYPCGIVVLCYKSKRS
ncbi:MAG: dihydrofolate reductase [Sphingobacteriales bacterium]|nr:MAG: dihydrofolate reductase [Sphingobacteriales bacterium]